MFKIRMETIFRIYLIIKILSEECLKAYFKTVFSVFVNQKQPTLQTAMSQTSQDRSS